MHLTSPSKGPNYAPLICGSLRSLYHKISSTTFGPYWGRYASGEYMRKYLILFLFIFSMPSWAEESPQDKKEPNYLAGFLLVEGLFALNSYMASESPEGYGALLTLLSPLGVSSNVSDTTNYVGIGGAMTLGLYNAVELKDESYSKSEIFKKNMVGWHLFTASIWLSEKFTGDKETVAYIAPLNDGTVLAINHRF